MEEQKDLPFPYEFRELDPEEDKLVKANLGSFPTNFVKVGPKGYMVYRPYVKDAANIYNLPLRANDVFVATYQRSGTTMTQELVWLIENDLNYEAAKVLLAQRFAYLDGFMIYDPEKKEQYESILPNPEKLDIEKYLELLEYYSREGSLLLASIPPTERRFIKTHLPLSLMPPSMLDTVKMVYIARDPRDVADLRGCIKRIADFFAKKLSEEQIQGLCDHLNFEKFKNNGAVNMEDFREIGILADGEYFIRKGQAGGWRDYFDEEMTKQADEWIKDNLKNSDLRFPHMEL
ncbi:hypothetical protein HF086_017892 [Spodoptera exigua]|uniref:Sulfotransferase domain-containing protein n=1 Tax=Spodoptera exigua TaxID=7107 RepID=A0A922SF21_SPOEX|nr:hypothetical protein HF086_017892 [Spodoptera exigua]